MTSIQYKPIVDGLAADIRSGRLAAGARLPTHRQLAAQEGIALVTASRVYAELEAMGLVSGEAGRGTFVREIALPLGHGVDQTTNIADMIDLNFNSPLLPHQTNLLRAALRELASAGDLDRLLHYQPNAGRKHERAIVAAHLANRGLQVSAEQTLMVNGAQQGLAVTVMALLKPGDVVVVDALTYPGFKMLAQMQHLELLPMPCLDDGPDLAVLEQLCQQRDVKAIYTMPTLHNPMGWVMPLEQRERLVAIADRYQLLIIEDAAYGFLVDQPPPPLATLAPERTVYISGLSKSLATGLRVGFVAAPLPWATMIERAIRVTTWNTPSLMTHIACRWLEDGTVARLENEKRNDAKERQVLAREVFSGIPYIGHSNAYFLWLPLPEEARADQIAMTLMQSDILVSTAEPFAVGNHFPHAIRVALGSVDRELLVHALTIVKRHVEYY